MSGDVREICRFAYGAGEAFVMSTDDLPIVTNGHAGPLIHGIVDRRDSNVLVALDPTHASEVLARSLLERAPDDTGVSLWRVDAS